MYGFGQAFLFCNFFKCVPLSFVRLLINRKKECNLKKNGVSPSKNDQQDQIYSEVSNGRNHQLNTH